MWLTYARLNAKQSRQLNQKFSGDWILCGQDWQKVAAYRERFGYFVGASLDVECRRDINLIKDWQATNQFV